LPRRVRTALERAFVSEATVSFQEKLHVLTTAQFADTICDAAHLTILRLVKSRLQPS
jgi:hypothetical protein